MKRLHLYSYALLHNVDYISIVFWLIKKTIHFDFYKIKRQKHFLLYALKIYEANIIIFISKFDFI